jgi:hypothetical protein
MNKGNDSLKKTMSLFLHKMNVRKNEGNQSLIEQPTENRNGCCNLKSQWLKAANIRA